MTVTGDSATQVKQGGLFEDFIDVFVHPAALFERARNQSFVRPALVQSIIFLILVLALRNLVAPFMDAEFARNMAASTADGRPVPEGAAEAAGKMASVMGMIGPVLAPWLIAIFGGLATWLASWGLGARLPYGQCATIAAWSYAPAILGYIVMAGFGAMVDGASVRSVADGTIGPARLVDPATTPPALFALLASLEIFALWGLVLTAIGVSVIARVPRSTGAVVAIVRFALGALVTVLPAALR